MTSELSLFKPMHVEKVADGLWNVRSISGSAYRVDAWTGACTCPRNTHTGMCSHVRRVQYDELLGEEFPLTTFEIGDHPVGHVEVL